jgi:hypothetical protein
MKAGDQPELLLQIGKSKVLAKGLGAIDAVKWPLRFLIFSLALALLGLGTAGHYGLPAALSRLF